MKPTQIKIDSIKENLFYRSRNGIDDYSNFDWHVYNGNIDTDKVNSSQALAIDFWGCLKMSPYKDHIINYIFNHDCTSWTIEFEYENKSILNEKKSTQIDVVLQSESTVIFIESKFCELDGGHCSQPNKTKSGKRQCNGNYEMQLNPVKNEKSHCALTGKGIKYWDYIDSLTSFNKNQNYFPCPIKEGEFQWIRNICFAEAYAEKNKLISETYLAYYKSAKCPISRKIKDETYLGKLKGKLNNQNSLRPIAYNDLIVQITSLLESLDKNERQVWLDVEKWMKIKEQKI